MNGRRFFPFSLISAALPGFVLSCTFFFSAPLQVLGALPVLSFAWWPDGSHGPRRWGLLGCSRSHVRLMYQSPRDSFKIVIRAADRPPRQWKLSPRDTSPSFSLSSAHADLNSKGDAAVTPALSQCLGVFANYPPSDVSRCEAAH